MCTSSPSSGQRTPVCPEHPLRRAVRVQHSRQLGSTVRVSGLGYPSPRVCQARMQPEPWASLHLDIGLFPRSRITSKCADTALGDLDETCTQLETDACLLLPGIHTSYQGRAESKRMPLPFLDFLVPSLSQAGNHHRKAHEVSRKRGKTVKSAARSAKRKKKRSTGPSRVVPTAVLPRLEPA